MNTIPFEESFQKLWNPFIFGANPDVNFDENQDFSGNKQLRLVSIPFPMTIALSCPTCRTKWLSNKLPCVLVYDRLILFNPVRGAKDVELTLDYRVFVGGLTCNKCHDPKRLVTFKTKDDEMTRMAELAARKIIETLGFKFDNKVDPQKQKVKVKVPTPQ